MKKTFVFSIITVFLFTSFVSADTFGTGEYQFEIDFVPISGDASSTNGMSFGHGGRTFSDPSNDYRMGTYEITDDQWAKSNNSNGTDVPRDSVTWYQATQFINWLNTSTGHQPVYKFNEMGDYAVWEPGDIGYDADNPFRNSNAFYFLPTENEWVKAAYWNGTTLQTYATVDDSMPTAGVDANYDDVIGQAWDVGSGSEELHGTFDMMGNVFEFMENPYYVGDYVAYTDRSAGGGYYSSPAAYLLTLDERSNHVNPDYGASHYGFRIASVPEPCTLLLLGMGGLLIRKR